MPPLKGALTLRSNNSPVLPPATTLSYSANAKNLRMKTIWDFYRSWSVSLHYRALHCLALLFFASGAQAGLYRWVDEAGAVHYSDVVPATVEKQGHSELNDQGMTIKTVPAAPTAEEIAASKRRETLAKLRDALENKQQEQDNHLLANYADVAELEAVFNSKLEVLDKNTRSIAERRQSLETKLEAVKAQTGNVEDAVQREKLAGYIQDAEKTLATYDYALQENQTEQDRLRQRL